MSYNEEYSGAAVLGRELQWLANMISQTALQIRNRYTLLAPVGSGGMGTVYRAKDRLTGEVVALKRLGSSAVQPAVPEVRLALAHEFQVLASLHHPHIIAVRDYGFDDQQQPFFTMELLAEARPFSDQSQFLGLDGRIDLLLQLLIALTYIHRRLLVHRDLKPGNVLVVQGEVKVLDFGLAAMSSQKQPTVGTLAYMAPELLQGQSATIASDLYAVGMMAYELFAGWHPYAQTQNVAQAVLHQVPDMTYLDLPKPLTAVLQQLFAKEPADRYPTAAAAIDALCAAAKRPLPPESPATRNSFLQAAPFIGREAELNQLTVALHQAIAGNGSAWLVGGESGIGKTRLLQEIRTHALVNGLSVLRGQAQQSGGMAYQLWGEALRQLPLLIPLDDLEAAVLRPILPTIAAYLTRPVPEAPPLEAKAAQTRLLLTVAEVLRRAARQQPLLLLLEDIHWADENCLTLLQHLNRLTADLPILLLASYRPGERPSLPQELPTMQPLPLKRLSAANVVELSAAMLGEDGRLPNLVAFLQRETEGNTFFIVEVMRTLAEEAGRLDKISASNLPETIFPGGVKQVIQRRLDRVPTADHDLLKLTAVAGRQLDLPLMAHLKPHMDLQTWLTTCVNAAVIERSDDAMNWQFIHDKVREALLQQMPDREQQGLHEEIGRGIEIVYTHKIREQYGRLAHHFTAAGRTKRQRRYLRLAAKQAEANYANEAALAYYRQLLPLLHQPEKLAKIHLQLAQISKLIGAWDSAEEHLKAALNQAETAAVARLQAEIWFALGGLARSRSQFDEALHWLLKAQEAFQAAPLPDRLCETLVEMANGHYQRGSYQIANELLSQALAAAQTANNPFTISLVQHNLGSVAYSQGQYSLAEEHFQAALRLRKEINDRPELANSYNNLGLIAYRQGDFAQAEAYFQQSLKLRRAIGDRWGAAAALSNLGMLPYQQRDYIAARDYWEEALLIRRALGEAWTLAGSLDNLALVAVAQEDFSMAKSLLNEALTLRYELNDRQGLAITLSNRARLALLESDWETAVSHYRRSLQFAHEIGDQLGVVFALVGIASGYIQTQTVPLAVTFLGAAQQHLKSIDGQWETDERALFDTSCQQARTLLSDDLFEQAWQSGMTISIEEAVAAALEGNDAFITV